MQLFQKMVIRAMKKVLTGNCIRIRTKGFICIFSNLLWSYRFSFSSLPLNWIKCVYGKIKIPGMFWLCHVLPMDGFEIPFHEILHTWESQWLMPIKFARFLTPNEINSIIVAKGSAPDCNLIPEFELIPLCTDIWNEFFG